TAVTVAGEPAQLRTMAFAWISEPCCAWRLSAELAQLPELTGTGLGTDVAPASPARHGQPTGDPIDIRLDETAHPAVLTLCGPHTASSVSIALGTLAQARTTASTAPRGPVPGRSMVASLMPAARFVAVHRRPQTGQEPQPWPSHGLGELCDDD